MAGPPQTRRDHPDRAVHAQEALQLEYDLFVIERLGEGWDEAELAAAMAGIAQAHVRQQNEIRKVEAAIDAARDGHGLPPVYAEPLTPVASGWPCALAGAGMVLVLVLALLVVTP